MVPAVAQRAQLAGRSSGQDQGMSQDPSIIWTVLARPSTCDYRILGSSPIPRWIAAMIYCHDRGGGEYTRLIPVDMLPAELQINLSRINPRRTFGLMKNHGVVALAARPGSPDRLRGARPMGTQSRAMQRRDIRPEMALPVPGSRSWWIRRVSEPQFSSLLSSRCPPLVS